MLNRSDILAKTLYGTRIYSAILREAFPEDDVVLHVTGRDYGNARNPFDNGNASLHIWREKLHPEQKLSDELTRHHDESGHIPDGDCFDFAERYYGLKDQALLDHLNEVLNLHIGDPYRQYAKPETEETPATPKEPVFSFFKRPTTNPNPEREVTLRDVYNYIIGPTAKEATEKLRTIEGKEPRRDFKKRNFDFVTFPATFSYRNEKHLLTYSGFLCADFDHLPNVEEMSQRLLKDPYFETLLLFRSPSGDGLKWVIAVDYQGHTHREVFSAVSNYIFQTYGVIMDQNCKDPTRGCFLPYDHNAYLNPKLL